MTFNEVLALIMPSFVSFLFFSKVTNRKFSIYETIFKLILFIVGTNCISYAIVIYIMKTNVFSFTPTFTLKYCVMATFISLVITIFHRFIELNIKIRLKVESND